ncbi:hypothetical protein [Ramlibacter sp. PS4R-6]|uniref:hypothetical protein n=1 Tax=Ramlibacter sp. PS4R-6 TaxID=3133438 RepID=UPI00309D275F
MQTLISVFDDRDDARKACERLKQQGFGAGDVHMHEGAEAARVTGEDPAVQELADHTMQSAEREVAVDRGALEALGHFFISLFGQDKGAAASGTYGEHVGRGHSVVVVDARTDTEAEAAAVTLHECGAIDVDDRDSSGGQPVHPGVRMYEREAPTMKDLVNARHLREESLLADRAGQVSKQMKEDREERAYAAPMTHTDRDRPK